MILKNDRHYWWIQGQHADLPKERHVLLLGSCRVCELLGESYSGDMSEAM